MLRRSDQARVTAGVAAQPGWAGGGAPRRPGPFGGARRGIWSDGRDHQFARLVRPDLLGLAVNAWLGWWWLDACAGRAVAGQRGRGACQAGRSQRWPLAGRPGGGEACL